MCKLENFPPIVHHICFSFISLAICSNKFYRLYPSSKKGIPFDLGMDKSAAKIFLGLLNIQGTPSSKFNNSYHAISSLDQRKSFKNGTSASSRPVQAYFPCAGLVKHLKISSRGCNRKILPQLEGPIKNIFNFLFRLF